MDVGGLINSFLGGGAGPSDQGKKAGGMPQGLVGGAAAGGLMALMLGTKKGRKLGGKALKYGGMAAVGGLAYKAYSDWQAGKSVAQTPPADPVALPKPPADSGFDPDHDTGADGDDFRLVLMRAMISAANSDGHIDADEHRRIREQIETLGLGAAEKAALFDYFSTPADPVALARMARTDEQRAEIYMASALAIDPDTPEEQMYLDKLARELPIAQGLQGHLDLEVAAARG